MTLREISEISKVYDAPGPFISLYLDTFGAVEDAATRFEIRWKDLQRELEDAGVSKERIEAIFEARGSWKYGNTRVIIANRDQVLLATSLPESPAREIVLIDTPLPHLLPLVAQAVTSLPYVVALVDRQGADILAYTPGSGNEPAISQGVEGPEDQVQKTGQGGWSQRGNELHIEQNWEHNAKEVVSQLEIIAQRIGAELIVVGGDVYAINLVQEHLPEKWRQRVQVIEGNRSADSGKGQVAERVLEQVAAAQARQLDGLLALFEQYRGRAESGAAGHPNAAGERPVVKACEGLTDTVEALRMAQVGTLLLADTFDGETELYFGPEAVHLGRTADELAAMGVDSPQRARAVDVLLRAAVGTDADVRILRSPAPDTVNDITGTNTGDDVSSERLPAGGQTGGADAEGASSSDIIGTAADPRAPREGVGALLRFATA